MTAQTPENAPAFDPAGGVNGLTEQWCQFNLKTAFESEANLRFVAPFPPPVLMRDTSGLTVPRDFASHGVDLFRAVTQVSPVPLPQARAILDFGVGVARLARMFKGFRGHYAGVDVDKRNIKWLNEAMPEIEAVGTRPRQRLPFADGAFDVAISISVFTHMNCDDHLFYLGELRRVVQPGGHLLLTVHGERALTRAANEDRVFDILSIPRAAVDAAQQAFASRDGFHFVRQKGHLTTWRYDYGITFISEAYVRRVWARFFEVLEVRVGAIHNFQDIVVLKRV